MSPFLALAAAALLAPPGDSAPADVGPARPAEVEAGTITYDAARDRFDLEGGVTLRRGEVTLRARSVRYDPKTGEVDATGGVFLFAPGRVLAADGLHAVLDGPYEAREVTAFFKDRPLDLGAAQSAEEARRIGRNRLSLRGDRIRGGEGDRIEADGAELTLCDCGGAPPTWQIRARHADVIPGKRAILTLPVLYVTPRFLFIQKPVPVLVLPWLYVPLGDRQTGLLPPDVSNTARSGWAFSLPFFVTLGRSWDATVTADYAFGPGEDALQGGSRGVQGPGTSLELRWAPDEGAAGQLRLFEMHDTARTWVNGLGGPSGSTPQLVASPPHGDRVALSLRHVQRISDGTSLFADVGLVNDANYVQDFTGDVLLRGAEYRRSAVVLAHRTDDLLLEADAAYHLPLQNLGQQDFPVADPATGLPRIPFGLFGGDVPAFHRLPAASATLLPVRIAGPLTLSASAGLARFAPIHGATGDEGAGGIGPGDRGFPFYTFPPWYGQRYPTAPALLQTQGAGGQGDGRWETGERLAATRLAARLELRAPIAVGRLLAIEPWIRASGLGYSFEASQPSQADGWLVSGITLSTQVSRSFASGPSRVLHLIEPRVEWAWGGLERGPALPAYGYDELDAPRAFPPTGVDPATGLPLRALSAMPPGGFHQLRLAVRNRFVLPAGPLSSSRIDVDVGQDVDLRGGSLSETWAHAGFGIGPLSGDVLARFYAFGAQPPPGAPPAAYPSALDAFTDLRLSLTLADSRGDDLHGGLLAFGPGGSPQTNAGIDPLFDSRPVAFEALAQGWVGARARVSAMEVSYEALFNARSQLGPRCDGTVGEVTPHVQQHVATFSWSSPCNCFKLGVTVAFRDCQGARPDVRAVFDLSQLSGVRF